LPPTDTRRASSHVRPCRGVRFGLAPWRAALTVLQVLAAPLLGDVRQLVRE
jgi:hypothetical protein